MACKYLNHSCKSRSYTAHTSRTLLTLDCRPGSKTPDSKPSDSKPLRCCAINHIHCSQLSTSIPMYMLCSRCHPAEQKGSLHINKPRNQRQMQCPAESCQWYHRTRCRPQKTPARPKKSKQNTSQYCMRQKSLCSLKMLWLVVKVSCPPKWTMKGTWPRKDALLGGGKECHVVVDNQASAGSVSTTTTSCSRNSWPRASTTTRRPRLASDTPSRAAPKSRT